ncbi:MAG: MFS transporter [Acidobacteria bacterium]|nr:MFS transporter [Acidobacteriota bacterium]
MTRIRWRLYGLLLMVVTLTFIDRFNMNVAAKHIQQEFALSDIQIGSLLSAFALGYALFQAPGGWLGDRFGARLVLTGAILWWSLFTALTAAAGAMGVFWLVRFLIGVGEGPALPCTNKMIGRWMAVPERARGSSLFLVAVGIGGAFTPPAIAWCMTEFGWRASFVACGLLGAGVAALWHWQSTETPAGHPGVNAEELAYIQAGRPAAVAPGPFPWRRLFASPGIPALIVANFMLGYVTYIFYTWFFLYLVNVRKLPVMAGSYWSTVPFLAILIGAPVGGYVSDRMVRKLGHPWGRRVPVIFAATMSCLLLTVGSRMQNPYQAIGLLAAAAGCNSIAAVTSWAVPNDLSDRYAGTLAGVLNTCTNLGGALSPVLTPYLATRFGWVAALDFAAAFMLTLGILWLLVHPERRID